jgi:hypothetical protein
MLITGLCSRWDNSQPSLRPVLACEDGRPLSIE